MSASERALQVAARCKVMLRHLGHQSLLETWFESVFLEQRSIIVWLRVKSIHVETTRRGVPPQRHDEAFLEVLLMHMGCPRRHRTVSKR